jgi:hypothetical protein
VVGASISPDFVVAGLEVPVVTSMVAWAAGLLSVVSAVLCDPVVGECGFADSVVAGLTFWVVTSVAERAGLLSLASAVLCDPVVGEFASADAVRLSASFDTLVGLATVFTLWLVIPVVWPVGLLSVESVDLCDFVAGTPFGTDVGVEFTVFWDTEVDVVVGSTLLLVASLGWLVGSLWVKKVASYDFVVVEPFSTDVLVELVVVMRPVPVPVEVDILVIVSSYVVPEVGWDV